MASSYLGGSLSGIVKNGLEGDLEIFCPSIGDPGSEVVLQKKHTAYKSDSSSTAQLKLLSAQ